MEREMVHRPMMFRDVPVGTVVAIPWGRHMSICLIRKLNGFEGEEMYFTIAGLCSYHNRIRVGGYRVCWAKFPGRR